MVSLFFSLPLTCLQGALSSFLYFQSVYWMVCFRHLFIGATLPGGGNPFVKHKNTLLDIYSYPCFFVFIVGFKNTKHNRDLNYDSFYQWWKPRLEFTSRVSKKETQMHKTYTGKATDTKEEVACCGRWTIHIVPVITGGSSRLSLFPLHLQYSIGDL